jgi:methylmalonyl-CoA mutase cobalamin-binding subunit
MSRPPSSALLSIGDLSVACGISPETLRVWERRYGKPVSLRLQSGHRRYSEEQVGWLRKVHELLAYGHRAGALLARTPGEIEELALQERTVRGDARARDWLLAFRAGGTDVLRARLRGELSLEESHRSLAQAVGDFLAQIGREWAEGRLTIGQEHAICEVVEDLLRSERARAEAASPAGPPLLTLATVSGERHGLGLQLAALTVAGTGARSLVLGIDLPVQEIAAATIQNGARAAGVSISLAQASPEVGRQIAELRRALPSDVELLVGGLGARAACRGLAACAVFDGLAELEAWAQQARKNSR